MVVGPSTRARFQDGDLAPWKAQVKLALMLAAVAGAEDAVDEVRGYFDDA